MGTLWKKFLSKGFALKGAQQTTKALSADGQDLKKVLTAFDLVLFGIGSIVGSGVFVVTGQVAREDAGPAVVLSYIMASLAALFSGLCYAEFAADIPVSGTAFNYIFAVYGEFMAWLTAINLVLEYTLSCSGVSKGISGYLATLIGLPTDALIIKFENCPYIILDFGALIATALLTIILVIGIKESSVFNNIVTGINVLTILFVICFSIPFFKTENLTPFMPFGVKGMFHGASVVFFSYVGFDTVATVAEEVKNPKRDLPIGVVGSILICTAMYVAMALSIVGLMSYTDIDPNAAFSAAFNSLGFPWVSRVVSAGALAGLVTALLTCLLGQARIFMVLGRSRLLPEALENVHPVTQTPVNATLVTFALTAIPTLLLNLDILADMVSVGTLFVLCLVCSGVLWRRHYTPEQPNNKQWVAVLLAVVSASSFGEGLTSSLEGPFWLQLTFLSIWLLGTGGFIFLPVVYTSSRFNTPLKPLVPSIGMLLTIHLIMSLGVPSYVRFVVWQVIGLIVYFSYSLHRSPDYSKDQRLLLENNDN